MVSILTEQNVQASMKALSPDDVLVDVQAELGDFSAGDFPNTVSTVPLGEVAARKVADKLRRYSMPAAEYQAYRAEQLARYRTAQEDRIRIDTTDLKHVNPKVVEATVGTESGGMVTETQAELDAGLRRLSSTEDFEKVDYRFEEVNGERVLVIKPVE